MVAYTVHASSAWELLVDNITVWLLWWRDSSRLSPCVYPPPPSMGSNSQHPLPPLSSTEQCPQPPPVNHSMIIPVRDFYNEGTRVFYVCAEGYSSKVTERTCESGGMWSIPEPECPCKSHKNYEQ